MILLRMRKQKSMLTTELETSKRNHDEVVTKLLSGLREQILQGTTLETVLDFVFTNFKSVLPYNRIGCALLDKTGDRIVARWCRSDREVILGKNFSSRLEGSSLQFILEQKRPRILNNLKEYLIKRPQSYSTQLIVNEGLQSSFTFPLLVEGQAVGFLFFSSTEINAYSKEHFVVFDKIAGLLSMGILIASQRDHAPQSHGHYIKLLESIVEATSPHLKDEVSLVASLSQLFYPGYTEQIKTAAMLTEAFRLVSDAKASTQIPPHDMIKRISELDMVSEIINHLKKQNDVLALQHGDLRDEPLLFGANIIRTIQQYSNSKRIHSSTWLPIEHLRREPDKFASFIVDELENLVIKPNHENVRQVMIKDLVDGMVFKEHVITTKGVILLSANHIIDEHIRRRLRKFDSYEGRVVEPLQVFFPH